MSTPKLTKECRQEKEAVEATWAWEKPALDGVFDALYKNYKDGKTPEVSPAERTALVGLAKAANKIFGLGIEPDKFAKIVIDCLPADLPALPKEYDIVKDVQRGGNNEGAMVPHRAPTAAITVLATIFLLPEAAPLALLNFLGKQKPGTRTFYFVHTSSMVLSILLFWSVHSMLVNFYTSMLGISPVLKSISNHMLETLNIEEQGFVRFIFNTTYEVCKTGLRFNTGEIQASDVNTALKGLANTGRLLVDIVGNAGESYRVMAEKVCMPAPGDRSIMGNFQNTLGTFLDPKGTSACISETISKLAETEKALVEARVGSSFGQITLMIKVAAICGTTSSLALAADLGLKVPAFIGRKLAAARGNQLALEGGKKSRRKSRKKTKKRAHKKPRKSRKKTGRRSRKTGHRSRKTGNRKRR